MALPAHGGVMRSFHCIGLSDVKIDVPQGSTMDFIVVRSCFNGWRDVATCFPGVTAVLVAATQVFRPGYRYVLEARIAAPQL